MKLGVLMRAGAVATVLWMIGATAYMTLHQFDLWTDLGQASYNICERMGEGAPGEFETRNHLECQRERQASYDGLKAAEWSIFAGSAGLAAILAAIGWLVSLCAYWSAQWILAGRKNIRKPD